MPFGLTNAPAVFQRFINEVLREMLNLYAFVYLDDILIFSASLPEHITHVCRVLQLIQQNYLYVKLEKSQFHTTFTSFLGFVVSRGHLQMDPAKIRAVISWPRPKSLRSGAPCHKAGSSRVETQAGGGQTANKNLEYIQSAKHLNPRQARWSLFFSWFDYVLSFRPGSRKLKPDTLSCQ